MKSSVVPYTMNRSCLGFTIAETAFCLVLLGLIFASVIKGAEAYKRTQVKASFIEIVRLEEAHKNFQQRFSATAGDLGDVGILPKCSGCIGGNGDGSIDRTGTNINRVTLATAIDPILDRETTQFWYHIQASGLFASHINTNLESNTVEFGENLPVAEAGGGYRIRAMKTANENGLFVVWQQNANGRSDDEENQTLRPVEAAYLDSKFDDNGPQTGKIRSIGGLGANGCTSTNPQSPYQTDGTQESCSLAVMIGPASGLTSIRVAMAALPAAPVSPPTSLAPPISGPFVPPVVPEDPPVIITFIPPAPPVETTPEIIPVVTPPTVVEEPPVIIPVVETTPPPPEVEADPCYIPEDHRESGGISGYAICRLRLFVLGR